jgi:hypothetical protein
MLRHIAVKRKEDASFISHFNVSPPQLRTRSHQKGTVGKHRLFLSQKSMNIHAHEIVQLPIIRF